MHAPLDHMNGNPVFDAEPSPTVLLGTDYVIRAANQAYLSASGRTREQLVGTSIFVAFPDNPDDPSCDGATKLQSSLEAVVRTGRTHAMVIQRYDIADPTTGEWTTKYVTPVNSPIYLGDELIGVQHRVKDATQLHENLQHLLGRYDGILDGAAMTDHRAREFVNAAAAFVRSARDYHELVNEVTNLRRALTSRATIDQAKGIIMAERRCTADEAFEVLAHMSNDTNVTVADVASALVYRAQGGSSLAPEAPARSA